MLGPELVLGPELLFDWNYCWAGISDELELGLGLN